MTPQECFTIYRGIKVHFMNRKYDFFEHQGRTKGGSDYRAQNDWAQFEKYAQLEKTYFAGVVLSNVIKNEHFYIRNFDHPETQETYRFWKDRIDNRYDLLLTELKEAKKAGVNIRSDEFIERFFENKLCLESLVYLDGTVGLFVGGTPANIIYELLHHKIKKYSRFLEYDKNVVSNTIQYVNLSL